MWWRATDGQRGLPRRRRDAFFSATAAASLSRRTLLSYGWPWLHTHTRDRIPDELHSAQTHAGRRYGHLLRKKKKYSSNDFLHVFPWYRYVCSLIIYFYVFRGRVKVLFSHSDRTYTIMCKNVSCRSFALPVCYFSRIPFLFIICPFTTNIL